MIAPNRKLNLNRGDKISCEETLTEIMMKQWLSKRVKILAQISEDNDDLISGFTNQVKES